MALTCFWVNYDAFIHTIIYEHFRRVCACKVIIFFKFKNNILRALRIVVIAILI